MEHWSAAGDRMWQSAEECGHRGESSQRTSCCLRVMMMMMMMMLSNIVALGYNNCSYQQIGRKLQI